MPFSRCLTPFRLMALAGLLPGLAAMALLWTYRPGGVVLQWRFDKDRPFIEESTIETEQRTKIDGMGAQMTDTVTLNFQWMPKEQDSLRNWKIDRRLQRVIVRRGVEDVVLYDSANGSSSSSFADVYKDFIGTKATLTVGPDTPGALVEMPRTGSPASGVDHARDLQQQLAQFVLLWTPPGPVHPGDTWEADRELPMGWMGSFQARCRFTYHGPDDNLDRIGMEMELEHQPSRVAIVKPLFRIKSGKLTVAPGAGGTAWFDRQRGRLDHAEISWRLQGKITLEVVGSVDQEIEVDTPTRTIIQISDMPPRH